MTSEEFRAELRERGLSQRALAMRLGLAVTTVNRWALALAPVPQYAVAYLELRRELAEISRRLLDAGLAKRRRRHRRRLVPRRRAGARAHRWGTMRHVLRYREDAF